MPKVSQFQSALNAYLKQNTSEFNTRYGVSGVGTSTSRPSSPSLRAPSPLSLRKRSNSQFELAKLALESQSPKNFNVLYGVSPKRKTRRNRKTRRRLSRRR